MRSLWRSPLLVSTALALLTLALYWPLSHSDLISYDDPEYITWNVDIQNGLTLPALHWAFTTGYAGNWHPLTWVSYMLDYQFFGGSPGQLHLTSLAFHVLNTLLLFTLFRRMTRAFWPSALVAAIFALHPLHVESVAWICERKDVLSTFFVLLSLIAYVRYAQSKVEGPKSKVQNHVSRFTLHASRFYFLSLFLFACSLMSKPMLVTLPCLLLLLDHWPLRRISLPPKFDIHNSKFIIAEKFPFLALSFTQSILTFIAQKAGGAVVPTATLPLTARLANALMAYLHYLHDAFWPTRLSICYPVTPPWPASQSLLAAAFLLALTALVLWQRQRPYLLTGWFWFLGTLVPVIGLVQTGAQTIADRFTYFPLIGLSICVAWGSADLLLRQRTTRAWLIPALIVSLGLCAAVTARQVSFWQNSLTVFSRALAVTAGNFVAHDHYGMALSKLGRHDEALEHYQEAVRLNPHYENAYIGLAATLGNRGDLQQAQTYALKALSIRPDFPEALDCLGVALLLQGKSAEAETCFAKAVGLRPSFGDARSHWGSCLLQQGKLDDAITQFREALRYQPSSADMRQRLDMALRQKASATSPLPETH